MNVYSDNIMSEKGSNTFSESHTTNTTTTTIHNHPSRASEMLISFVFMVALVVLAIIASPIWLPAAGLYYTGRFAIEQHRKGQERQRAKEEAKRPVIIVVGTAEEAQKLLGMQSDNTKFVDLRQSQKRATELRYVE